MGKISLYAPIAYLVLLLSSLALFSTIYRRRKVRRLVGLKPWFDEHDSRDIYLSLKVQTSPKVPEKMIKAALLRRATEDVRRIMSLQESKPALAELHQRGAVGDEIWTRFLAAEKVMDAEIMECAGEANFIKPGWAQTLFPSAAEIVQNSRIRDRLAQVPELQKEEREKWERVRETVLSELENEIDTAATETEAKKANKKRNEH
ncbi:Sec62/63 complex, subunit Sec66 [Lipomyces starkeyi]